MPLDPERFLAAQRHAHDDALRELRSGRKVGHWIWFVFPQLAGLGRSPTSVHYAIGSLDDARAYLAHPVLGARLRECAEVVLATEPPARTAAEIFGDLDAMKLRSSMTLFARADPFEQVFGAVLERFFGGVPDALTDRLLG